MVDRTDLEARGRDLDKRLRVLASQHADDHAFQSIAELHLGCGKLETEVKGLARRSALEQPRLVR